MAFNHTKKIPFFEIPAGYELESLPQDGIYVSIRKRTRMVRRFHGMGASSLQWFITVVKNEPDEIKVQYEGSDVADTLSTYGSINLVCLDKLKPEERTELDQLLAEKRIVLIPAKTEDVPALVEVGLEYV